MSELGEWDSFYVIVGGAAGALIGLQFVVMTLIAERPSPGIAGAGPAFATPAVVHFSLVLLLSALLRAPWPNVRWAAAGCGVIGVCGLVYVIVLLRRILGQSAYKPDAEDWTFHVALPLLSYLLLALTRCRPWPMSARFCSPLAAARCCSCSSAFTMPGTR